MSDGILVLLQAVDFVASKLQQGMSPKDVCEALCDRCMAPDTETDGGKGCDNMSAMVIVLKPYCEIAAALSPVETGTSSAGALAAGVPLQRDMGLCKFEMSLLKLVYIFQQSPL